MKLYSVLPLGLKAGGSVTLTGLETADLYIVSGTTNLTTSLSYIFDGSENEPVAGSYFTIWFENTTISVNEGRKIFILGQDFTALLVGTNVNQFFTCIWDGTQWNVSNTTTQIDTLIAAALGAYTAPVLSVAGKTGVVTLAKADVGLNLVDNTSDNLKPVSIAQATAIATAQSAATAVGNAAQITANNASTSATAATARLNALLKLDQVASWDAAPQTVVPATNFYALNVAAVNGDVTLNITPLTDATAYSEITIILGFTGSYTITNGSNCAFTAVSGTASVTKTLTLVWNGTTYFQK